MSTPKQAERLKRRLYMTRDCGTCEVCCTILPIQELEKPADVACSNLKPEGKGCAIYPNRPTACREWACIWRSGSDLLHPSSRPDRLGIMFDVTRQAEGRLTAVLAYETRPGAFKELAASLELSHVAAQYPVALMNENDKPGKRMIGPPELVKAFLAAERAYEVKESSHG